MQLQFVAFFSFLFGLACQEVQFGMRFVKIGFNMELRW